MLKVEVTCPKTVSDWTTWNGLYLTIITIHLKKICMYVCLFIYLKSRVTEKPRKRDRTSSRWFVPQTHTKIRLNPGDQNSTEHMCWTQPLGSPIPPAACWGSWLRNSEWLDLRCWCGMQCPGSDLTSQAASSTHLQANSLEPLTSRLLCIHVDRILVST